MKFISVILDDLKKGENYEVYITIVIAAIVALFGFFGGIDQHIALSVILACLALLSGNLLGAQRSNKELKNRLDESKLEILNALSEGSNNIIRSFNGVKVTSFNTRQSYTEHRSSRLKKAKKIDDVSWRIQGYSTQTYTRGEIDTKNEEMEMISEIVKKPDVIWRGVAIFAYLEHLEREKQLIIDPENAGYNFGVYEANLQRPLPLVGFMIIDDEELFIAYPPKSIRLTIQHPQITALFSAYFEDIWQSSVKLKQGEKVNFQKLEQIETELKKFAT